MKAHARLLPILLATLALPCVIQAARAQASTAAPGKAADTADSHMLRNSYAMAYLGDYKYPAYSAEEVTDTTRTLPDGNQIKSSKTGMRYRDRNGRVRYSYWLPNGPERIFIADIEARTAWLIRPDRKDVLRVTGAPSTPRYVPSVPPQTKAPDWDKEVMTSLGVKDVAGVKAVGLLTETHYPAGARGNSKDMTDTVEIWTSRELNATLYSRSVSALLGERVVHYEHLAQGDVPDAVFALPVDYDVRDVVSDGAQAAQ